MGLHFLWAFLRRSTQIVNANTALNIRKYFNAKHQVFQ